MTKKSLLSTISIIFLITNLYCQNTTRKIYSIPKGQYVNTNEITGITNLEPYKKTYFEEFDGRKTKIIEVGDFIIRKNETGYDTLNYKIKTYKISQGDTIIEERKLVLRKKLNYDTKAR